MSIHNIPLQHNSWSWQMVNVALTNLSLSLKVRMVDCQLSLHL